MQKFTKGYLKQSWADLKQDRRWWQPLLILTLIQIIPIFGQIVALGYMFDWAKEASWGVNRPFPRQIGDLGKRIKYGFFALIIMVIWVYPITIVANICNGIPVVGGLIYLVGMVVAAIASAISYAGVLRGLTYERIAPGLQIKRIINMAQKDAGGMARCWLISFVGGLIVCAIACIVLLPLAFAAFAAAGGVSTLDMGMQGYMYGGDYMNSMSSSDIYPMLAVFAGVFPLLLILGFILSFLSMIVSALCCRAYGYWLGQFQPARWGRAEDPMPFERMGGAPYVGAQAPGAQQTGAYGAAGAAGAAAAAAAAQAQQTRDAELYEEAQRATDPGAMEAEWEREFMEYQQTQQAQNPALEGEVAQEEEQQPAEQVSYIPQEVEPAAASDASQEADVVDSDMAGAEEPAQSAEVEVEPQPAAEDPAEPEAAAETPAGWRSASNAAAADAASVVEPAAEPAAEPEAAAEAAPEPEPAAESESVAEPIVEPEVSESIAETPTGWRSASNAAAADAASVVEPAAEPAAEPEAAAEPELPAEPAAEPEKPAQTGWRSASNGAN